MNLTNIRSEKQLATRYDTKSHTFSVFCKDWLIKRLLSFSCCANPTISSVKSSWSFLLNETTT